MNDLIKGNGRIVEWRRDPNKFVRDQFHVQPDRWQAEVLSMIGRPGRKRIAMKSCAGPGKSALLAWAGWHRLACFGDLNEHPRQRGLDHRRQSARQPVGGDGALAE